MYLRKERAPLGLDKSRLVGLVGQWGTRISLDHRNMAKENREIQSVSTFTQSDSARFL